MHILRVKSIEFTHIFLCPLWFPAFSAVLSLLCRHCCSCYTTVEIEVRSLDFVS